MKRNACTLAVLTILVATASWGQISTSILRPVGYHPSDVTYFNTPYLGNSMAVGGEWRQFPVGNNNFGDTFNYHAAENLDQFVNGYPQFLGDGTTNRGPFLRALLFGVNINNTHERPAGWPERDNLGKGRYVLTWQGNADIRLEQGTLLTGPGESTVPATGSFLNGRRTYLCETIPQTLEIRAITTPITDIKVWLPGLDDPATPSVDERRTTSLEGQLFHPIFLQRIADADYGFIRFMDWGKTNASPQQDWIDRRLPNHVFQFGIINDRPPNDPENFGFGDRETGVAYEHMVALCNATGRNMWINIPHLATTDYITKLAQLIRFGSDGVNPYTQPNANPVFPPLNADLKVYVEFSNEIWSSGFAFPQGNWAEEQAAITPGLGEGIENKAKFTARKFCDTWRIFENIFVGSTSRLIRVAAIFTALESYTRPYLTEIGTYGTQPPATRPDVLALTTYFGNDIQGFVDAQDFTARQGATDPRDGKLFNDPYWTSPLFSTHMTAAFTEWKRRILAGDAASGGGPDATGISGGFASSLRTLPNETLPYCDPNATTPCLPLIAYEGGPSIFTNYDFDDTPATANNGLLDGDRIDTATGLPSDDHVTIFMEAMNRDPRIFDVYRIHLELAKSKGLWTHNPYTDTSPWSRFGQWGHLELLEQAPATSPKYSLMLEHASLHSTLKHIDAAVGAVPSFVTSATLQTGIAGQAYTANITTTGGNGARSVVVVGSLLDAGLTISSPSADTLQISGTPITSRKNFIFARVQDADGDPAWRTFTLETFGGPGTLVQSNFQGTSPANNRPWTPTFVLDNTKVSWGGWNVGAGALPQPGDNAFVFTVNGPSGNGSDAQDSTLAQARADNEFLTATITPTGTLDLRGAEVRFTTRRGIVEPGFHSPRGYALFSSVGGFATDGAAIYTSPLVQKDNFDEVEHIAIIPTTAAFQALTSTVTFRIYAFGAQFSGHHTSLTGFKLTAKNPLTITSLSSNAGPTAGGQSVIISGADLANATSVTFGGTAAPITAGSNTATDLTVVTPAKSAGTVNVVVTTPNGSVTLTGAYRYLAAPTISSITPNSGPAAGGQSVTITGTNLANVSSVTFDGLPAAPTANTATSITVVTPPHIAGAVNVVVNTAGGSATSSNGYTYVAPAAPSIPTGFTATATSATNVSLGWAAATNATSYRVSRRTTVSAAETFLTTSNTSLTDTITAGTTVIYKVQALGAGGTSAFSSVDVATGVVFTDDPLVAASTVVKSVHMTQLRTAVNAMRTAAGLATFNFTNSPTVGTTIRASQLTQLRSNLDAARSTIGLSPITYTDQTITAGTTVVKAAHITQLRNGVK